MEQPRTVITVGHFNGVHRGHAALVARAREIARAQGATVVAMAFTRDPLTVLRPDRVPPTVMHRPQREAALLDAGADRVEWLEPTETLLGLTPETFVDQVVLPHRPVAMVEGPDFRFGRGRQGDVERLRSLGAARGFTVETVDPVVGTLRDKTTARISSSLVRWLVRSGRMADARLVLGRPFTLRGEVVPGDRRGQSIGFPTANLDCGDQVLPAEGVYAVHAELWGVPYVGAMSVGARPAVEDPVRTVEVHLDGVEGDLYGRTLEVAVHRWLRDQHWFADMEALQRQLTVDLQEVRAYQRAALLAPAARART